MSSRELHVVWGVNRWVLIETPTGSVEQQVASEKEFTALLTQVGLSPEEAKEAAGEQWKRRPRDAGTTAARPDESRRRATGLRPRTIALLVALNVSLFVILAWFGPWGRG
jgi:hypothetical protein